ncbi:MAG: CPBP family intramembrane metalloprotease [Bacteroidales bacterium]|nr:MAG: CPBP family intramembrane metalloprotease [Bacteroidales bacterium]
MKNLIKVNQLFTNRVSESSLGKLLQFPLSRILIALLFIAPVIAFHNAFSFIVLDNIDGHLQSILHYSETAISIILIFLAYNLYVKKIEKRTAFEINTKKWYTEFSYGVLIGGGLVILTTLFLALSGFYKIESFNSPFVLFERIFRYGIGSFIEEIIFTIIIFKLIEEFAGTITSTVIVSLLFGFMHLGNDNATLMSSLCMAIEHIILLSPFILTRRIWMVWAVHFSWNYFQTAIFGMNNSGMAHKGFINPTITGPDWITGGSFGIEASYIAIILQCIVGIVILKYAYMQAQIVSPIWIRSKGNKLN